MNNQTNEPIHTEQLLKNCRGKLDFAQKLLDIFLNDSQLRLDELLAAYDAGNLESIQAHAHALKGSAATVAASAVSDTAAKLETAARHNDQGLINSLVPLLQSNVAACKEFSLS